MKIAILFGTRPEAIKLAPVVRELSRAPGIRTLVVNTGQHTDLLRPVLDYFQIRPDLDMALLRPKDNLSALFSRAVDAIGSWLRQESPDMIVVQGDTLSAMVGAACAFLQRIPVAHVEAGLRSGDFNAPYPEEWLRRIISLSTTLHFAPTARAEKVLLAEGYPRESVVRTGNTVIDALHWTMEKERGNKSHRATLPFADTSRKLVLVTAHRRENQSGGIANVCEALNALSRRYPAIDFAVFAHPNPASRQVFVEKLTEKSNLRIVEPQSYERFVALMHDSFALMTDSGGLQEEACALGRPTLVLRDVTERPEAVESGVAKLVGTEMVSVTSAFSALVEDTKLYQKMATPSTAFGRGDASQTIRETIERWYAVRTPLRKAG